MFVLTSRQIETLKDQVDTYWTNPNNGLTSPQYHVVFDCKRYLLDIHEDTNELISVSDWDLVWSQSQEDSDMQDLLSQSEYMILCENIVSELNKLNLIESLYDLDVLPSRHKILRSEMRKVEYK